MRNQAGSRKLKHVQSKENDQYGRVNAKAALNLDFVGKRYVDDDG